MTDVPVPRVKTSEKSSRSAGRPVASKRRWGLWFIAICLAGAGIGYLLFSHFALFGVKNGSAGSKMPQRAIPVVTATAKKGDLNVYLTSLGTVTAFNTVTIRSRVDGQLMEVAFTEGEMVQEGSLLAQIDPRPFQVQLAQSEGQLAKDEATLKDARFNLDRVEKLADAKAVTPQQLDAAQAAVDQLEGALKSDKAQIENAKLQLTYSRITAPISGRIGLRRVDKGNLVQANDLNGLAVITQLQPIAVIFTVPQDDIIRVLKNNLPQDKLVVEAYNRDLVTKLATGSLKAIDNQVDPATGTVRLKAIFPNLDQALFPNQFVNTRLLIETRRDAVLVPNAAVQQGPASRFAYVVKPDETVELRTVVVGPSEGDQSVIESGLSPGEIVVTEGTDKLQPGSQVNTSRKQPPGRATPDSQPDKPAGNTRGGVRESAEPSAAPETSKTRESGP